MTELTARGGAAPESRAGTDFSATPWPTIRRILEAMVPDTGRMWMPGPKPAEGDSGKWEKPGKYAGQKKARRAKPTALFDSLAPVSIYCSERIRN